MDNFDILAIDLSKKSTGVSLFNNRCGVLSLERLHTIRFKNPSNYSKLHFIAKDFIIEQFEELYNSLSQVENLTVAMEYPIFGAQFSELQFYLSQELLEFFYRKNVDVVGYGVSTLQAFIRRCSKDKSPKSLNNNNKNPIRNIYKKYIFPENDGWLLPEDCIDNSDEMDAVFLGLLGCIYQSCFLKKSNLPFPFIYSVLDRKDDFKEILNFDTDIFFDKFDKNVEDIKFDNLILDFEKFKDLNKKFRNKKHLTLENHLFFPFDKLSSFEVLINQILESEENGGIEFLAKKFKTTKKNVLKIWKESDFWVKVGFNRKGGLFFIRR